MNYDSKKYGHPDLFVENSLTISNEQIKYRLELAIKKSASIESLGLNQINLTDLTARVIEARKFEGVFYERLELFDFPMDLQEISIKLSSKRPINEVKLYENVKEKSYVNLECFMDQQQYNLLDSVKIRTEEVEDNWKKFVRSQFIVSSFVVRKVGFFIYKYFFFKQFITSIFKHSKCIFISFKKAHICSCFSLRV